VLLVCAEARDLVHVPSGEGLDDLAVEQTVHETRLDADGHDLAHVWGSNAFRASRTIDEESTMSAVLPVLLCGGGCLAMCWLMMRGMHRQGDDREAGRTASGSPPDGDTDGHDA
jgi:hypothetical protein